jgi:hypothetical protein
MHAVRAGKPCAFAAVVLPRRISFVEETFRAASFSSKSAAGRRARDRQDKEWRKRN